MKIIMLLLGPVVASLLIAFKPDTSVENANSYEKLNGEILQLFNKYPIVAVAEGNHNNALANEWLKTLIAHKSFPHKVNNIVVEFGASKYQATMDDFMQGKPVPDSLFKNCWRETTQLITWDHQVYEEFFRKVRKINEGLPASKKIRVLLGDPTFEEFFKINRDLNAFKVIEKEVLAKKQTALMIYGGMHLVKKDINTNYTTDTSWVVQRLEKKYPGKTFNIWNSLNTNNPAISNILKKEKISKPAFLPTSQTGLGNLDFATILPFQASRSYLDGKVIAPSDYTPMPMKNVFDGILYLGTWEEATYAEPRLATVYDDTVYVKELIRRAATRKDIWQYQFDALVFEKAKRTKSYKSFINALQTTDTTAIQKEYKKVVASSPGFHLIYTGYDLLEQKQIKAAILAFELGTQHHPTDAYLFESLADACVIAGEKSKALKYYEQAVKLNPGSMAAKKKWNNLKN